MGSFTFVPLWVLQDILVYAVGLVVILFMLKHEEHPETTILELVAFCFLYAAVYENFATLMGWYGYGRSILMVFNVPLSVPLVEYLVVYSSLRLLALTKAPTWTKPFIVGLSGMVFDFSLDPLALRQIFETHEGRIGRWSWYPGAADAQLYGEPVYNYTGWILLCGLAAATILLGRYWYKRSGYRRGVALAYPFLAMVAALGLLVSPLSRFLLWLWPFMDKGSAAEWIMLGVNGGLGLCLLLIYGKRKTEALDRGRYELPALLSLGLLPLCNLLLCLRGGYWEVLWLIAAASLLQAGYVLFPFLSSRLGARRS